MSQPAGVVLAHGAGSGPWVFGGWEPALAGRPVLAVDLQAGLDVARASMRDYARAVSRAAYELGEKTALVGWSMGGLVALMAAAVSRPSAVVLLEPSPPGEVQGYDRTVEPAPGSFDPEAVYGPFPAGGPARPESSLARAERKRGVSVPSLGCPSLVVYGDDFPDDRGRSVAARYGSEELRLAGLDHWGIVRDPRVPPAVVEFLDRAAAA